MPPVVGVEEVLRRIEPFPGWFFKNEAELLYKTATEAARLGGEVVEIGSYCGRSTVVLAMALRSVGQGLVYAIDPHEGDISSGRVSPTWDTFLRNIKAAGVDDAVVPVRQRSTDVPWTQEIALLFIDGLHDYASVAADYRHFFGHVQPNGFIAFHDYSNSDHPDVRKFVSEAVLAGEVVVHELPPEPGKEASLVVTRKRASLSVVIPTCGRETLERTLESITVAGITKADEIIIVGDGPQPVSRRIAESFRSPARITYLESEETRAFGGRQRNLGMEVASRSHLVFIDDDDCYLPDALRWMREAAEKNPSQITLFRIQERRDKFEWDTVWTRKKVEFSNVGTQGILLPNRKQYFGTWPSHPGSDYHFLRGTVDRWPGREPWVVWDERVVVYLY